MRAVQITRFGGPEVLEMADVPEPTPGQGQQLYDVSTGGHQLRRHPPQGVRQLTSDLGFRNHPCPWSSTGPQAMRPPASPVFRVIASGPPGAYRSGMFA
jgi:hypothetical protein